jgi:3-methylcrotonyl-CoA carboxylase alpha subunit
MRTVAGPGDLASALRAARSEALSSFGNASVYIERRILRPRHIEIQLLGDHHGTVVPFVERECSIQRRHQKVVEESPSPVVTPELRRRLAASATAVARHVGYVNAGTIEFLLDENGEYFFLEMNTRLQVEHPVTEMITGLDLVEWQLRVASGEPLPLAQEQVPRRGHAVEARLYAEDPQRGFLPSTGTLTRLRFPAGSLEHVRVDAGVQEGDEVSVHYDPMLAKIIAWAPDRLAAIDRLRAALELTEVDGVRTNARFLWEILGLPAVRSGDVSTQLVSGLQVAQDAVSGTEVAQDAEAAEAWLIAAAVAIQRLPGDEAGVAHAAASPWEAATGFRVNAPATIRVPLRLGDEAHWLDVTRERAGLHVTLAGRTHRVQIEPHTDGRLTGHLDGRPIAARCDLEPHRLVLRRQCRTFEFHDDTGADPRASAEHEGHFRAPMPGHVLDVRVAAGQAVKSGAVLVVLEAMKMEHSLLAPWDGQVKTVSVKAGDRVEEGADLVLLEPTR